MSINLQHMLLLLIRYSTCLSRNSLASFSMWPSYRLVVRLIRPIFDKPKSVSLMWPIDVIRRLGNETSIELFKLIIGTTHLEQDTPVRCWLISWWCWIRVSLSQWALCFGLNSQPKEAKGKSSDGPGSQPAWGTCNFAIPCRVFQSLPHFQ